MGSQVAMVKGNRQMGPSYTHYLVLVKRGRRMGSQVNRKRRKKEREMRERKEKEKKKKHKKKKLRFLNEWIQQVRKIRRQVFLYKAYYAKH